MSARRCFRLRHYLILLPLGLTLGTAIGAGFHDLTFGLGVGGVFGVLFATLLTFQTRSS